MYPTRKIILGGVILAVLFLVFLARRSEGLTGTCGTSLADFKGNNWGDGQTPPLDPQKCTGKLVSRNKQCYKVKNGKWEKTTNTKDKKNCPSWVKMVQWSNSSVREKTENESHPFRRPQDYKRHMNKNSKGDSHISTYNVKTANECADKCNANNECGGFALNKAKGLLTRTCWLLPHERVTGKYYRDTKKHSYVKNSASGPRRSDGITEDMKNGIINPGKAGTGASCKTASDCSSNRCQKAPGRLARNRGGRCLEAKPISDWSKEKGYWKRGTKCTKDDECDSFKCETTSTGQYWGGGTYSISKCT
jgi:hypothetical protein